MSDKISEWILNCPRLTSREEIAEKVAELEFALEEIVAVMRDRDSSEGGNKYLDGFMVDWWGWLDSAKALLGYENATKERIGEPNARDESEG